MTLFQSSPNDWMKLKRCSNVFAPESGESHMKRVGMLIVSLSGVGGGGGEISDFCLTYGVLGKSS